MKALFDMDGTMAGIMEFNYEIFKEGKEEVDRYLKEWNASTVEAPVLMGGVEKLKELKEKGYEIVLLTARGVDCKKYTVKKLREMGVLHLIDSMWHRPKRMEGVSSSVYKRIMIEMFERKGWKFEISVDDEEKNLVMMKEFGMEVIDARQWW